MTPRPFKELGIVVLRKRCREQSRTIDSLRSKLRYLQLKIAHREKRLGRKL